MLPGGIFPGDYYVADIDPLLNDLDLGPGNVKIHRVQELSPRPTVPKFRIAEKRQRRDEVEGSDYTPSASATAEHGGPTTARVASDAERFGPTDERFYDQHGTYCDRHGNPEESDGPPAMVDSTDSESDPFKAPPLSTDSGGSAPPLVVSSDSERETPAPPAPPTRDLPRRR